MYAFQSSSEGVQHEQYKGVFIVKFGCNTYLQRTLTYFQK